MPGVRSPGKAPVFEERILTGLPDTIQRLNTALAGRYEIERELARGGMAVVYLAEDVKHRRSVALKVFGTEVASVGAGRFLREIEVAARLNHPHILPLYDSGQVGDVLYYVMPYVRGESLRATLERRGRLPSDEAIGLAHDIASALDYAHAHGVIHRDIKPENILIHEGEAMVMDFGIARALSRSSSDTLTGTGFVVGTPAYMSPEQALGSSALDRRTDIYSLGCVVFEMLVGSPPFVAANMAFGRGKRFLDTVPRVRQVLPEAPVAVDEALARALAPDPEDRFRSAGAFAEALRVPGAAAREARSIAVLPFLNLSRDPENDYFADGITEDVIAQLSKVPALSVISRSSVMRFKARDVGLREIAGSLGATTLLDGSVRRAGDRVRIVAQLIDPATGQHLWVETYDRDLTDIFAIQSDVAIHIAQALNTKLSADEANRIGKPPTDDFEAYQLYLKGRHHLVRYTTDGMLKGVDFFERAIARDSHYALAYAGVALAYMELGETGMMKPLDAYLKSKEAVTAALAYDPGLSEAYTVQGNLKAICDFDWAGAEAEFKKALELSPSNADAWDFYARVCAAQERFDEAVDMAHRARELDPIAHRADFVTMLLRAGRYEEALAAAKSAVEFDPAYDRVRATMGWALIKNGRPEEGLAELEAAVSLAPSNAAWTAQLGQACALTGRTERARELLDRLQAEARERYVSPYHFAYVYTGLGELDTAIDWLERAYHEQSGAIYGVKGSFLFAPLKGHPRFTALLRKINLA
jgi:eukaryotic-like serine/threonine-protein kinase